jgi:hypothetical protein
MAEMTALDLAHIAVDADPDDDDARLRFYGLLARTELFVLLADEAAGSVLKPALFDLSEGVFAMAFDAEDRLAAFAEAPAPYAALPGRALVAALAGGGPPVGLGVNLGVAPSSALLPPEALAWLAGMLAREPEGGGVARPVAVEPPGEGTGLIGDLARDVLAGAAGQLADARLVTAVAADGARRLALVAVGAAPGAEVAIAQAVGDALAFSGLPVAALDVIFLAPGDALAAMAAAVGLSVIDAPLEDEAPTAQGPGMDPDRPPRLR